TLANQPLAEASGAPAQQGGEAAAPEADESVPSPDDSKPLPTLHPAQRAAERGISPADINEAMRSAEESGQVAAKMGKYGTPQAVYKGTNNVTVVVEQAGSNKGKVITVFRTL
ncbi:MAG: DUF4258 domain-containing protein, partial [Acidobacteriota bacterium]|nr:DUF4258 domain-containing protein [Acidobacteriota bacterium]